MGRCPFSGGWGLLPMWGMTSIEERLLELLDDYQPRQLIIAGDLVHDQTSAAAATLLARLRERCAVVVLAGATTIGTRDA